MKKLKRDQPNPKAWRALYSRPVALVATATLEMFEFPSDGYGSNKMRGLATISVVVDGDACVSVVNADGEVCRYRVVEDGSAEAWFFSTLEKKSHRAAYYPLARIFGGVPVGASLDHIKAIHRLLTVRPL